MKPYYEADGITIYHGDCLDILPGLSADAIITDPPYGVNFDYGTPDYDDGAKNYQSWVAERFAACRRAAPLVLLTAGIANLWHYPKPSWVLCWAKPGSTRRNELGGFNEWEPVLVYGKRRIYNDFKYLPDCSNHSDSDIGHPCPKPLRLLLWLVSICSDPGTMILDPFVGAGTTLRAAKDLGRKAIGIEIEERYCEIAAKRMAQRVLPIRLTSMSTLFQP